MILTHSRSSCFVALFCGLLVLPYLKDDGPSAHTEHRELLPSFLLDFEGIGNLDRVAGYYNGAGRGINYGVVFDKDSFGLIVTNPGGSASFPNMPRPKNTVLVLSAGGGSSMTYDNGFTFLSFYYSSSYDGYISVYDGLSGSGTVLANVKLSKTELCNRDSCGSSIYTQWGWVRFEFPFPRAARSVRFHDLEYLFYVDNMVITPLPALITLDFAGVVDNAPVGNYYNGAGVAFGTSARGLAYTDSKGRPNTALAFDTSDPTMMLAKGFTALSFQYLSYYEITLTLYDNQGGTGNVLTTVKLPSTLSSCQWPCIPVLNWKPYSVSPFPGVAKSAKFSTRLTCLIDDMSITRYVAPTVVLPTESPTSFGQDFTESPTSSPTKQPTSSPTKSPTSSPSKTPTSSPTKTPTSSPSKSPTSPPSKTPTSSPTKSPTKQPTKSPTTPPCTKTTYWLYNATSNKVVRELKNNTASCIAVPYNIEVRPCPNLPRRLPVSIVLLSAASRALRTQFEFARPYFLWGDTTATGDVYPNKKPLPKGTYWLHTTMDRKVEKITFNNTCS